MSNMHTEASNYIKDLVKAEVKQLPDANQRFFKTLYGRDHRHGNRIPRRSLEDAHAMEIDAVVDEMHDDELGTALDQIRRTAAKS